MFLSSVKRAYRKFELYAICMVWPVSAVTLLVGSYKLFMWSYGGKECFRYIVIQEPFKEQWYQANPKSVLGRETPLANVPQFLETPGHGSVGETHAHHNNY